MARQPAPLRRRFCYGACPSRPATGDAIDPAATPDRSAWSIFLIFLRLGLTSFGGPIAHLGYFRQEFVSRRRWLSEQSYADLVALCQFLPGPGSSQVGMALGLSRCGYLGALAAWAGFTLPTAVVLILFALGISRYGDLLPAGVLHGLQVVAVAVVAQALWGMARTLCRGALRLVLMALTAMLVLLVPTALGQIGAILLAGLVGLLLIKPTHVPTHEPLWPAIRARAGLCWLGLFVALLIALPLLRGLYPSQGLAMVDIFYRSSALVFGGGHVMLPLLQAELVPAGWITDEVFLAGYGATQAMPGPLFAFAAFIGASLSGQPNGWLGGLLGLVAIFLPSMLLVFAALPFWERLRRSQRSQAALAGINAAVVGLLLAALYDPLWTSAIRGPQDIALALLALVALMLLRLPPWLVVLASGVLGGVSSALF